MILSSPTPWPLAARSGGVDLEEGQKTQDQLDPALLLPPPALQMANQTENRRTAVEGPERCLDLP